jgi:predicted ATPase
MQGKKLLHSIRLTNLLSYGSEGVTLELEPLNVLIGPNASGKSNLIEAISLLAAAPKDIFKPFREGGGTSEWLWKGDEGTPTANLLAVVENGKHRILYTLGFTAIDFRLRLVEEQIYSLEESAKPLYSLRGEVATLAIGDGLYSSREYTLTKDFDRERSILSQRRDPLNYPELTYLGDQFGRISFFRDWRLGRASATHQAQRSDLPTDFLLEDASNLALILNDLQNRREIKRLLLEKLKVVYEGVEDVTTRVQGGTIQVLFHERGIGSPVPASRLSDGTLHYLCLLVILLHPEPPPLICIEEPELGLHPDIIPIIAELLIEASQRTQLIVTTHSDTLVSALSEVPEAVVVCERDNQGTKLRRLDPENLKEWLERYRLGDLWAKGEIGGNRW